MSYITAEEYAAITGDTAPADFSNLAALADAVMDNLTTYGFVGRDISSLPALISGRFKAAVAYQIQYLANMGGLSAVNEGAMQSMSLGNYSYSAGDVAATSTSMISPAALACVPVLVAYIRGVRKYEAYSCP